MKIWKNLGEKGPLNLEIISKTPGKFSNHVVYKENDFVPYQAEVDKFRNPVVSMLVVVKGKNDEEDNIVLVRQPRPATGKWQIETPAGRVDENETAKEAAIRELKEEVGITPENPENIVFLTAAYPSMGINDEKVHFFIIEDNFKKSKLIGDQGEEGIIETFLLPVSQIDAFIKENKQSIDLKLFTGLTEYSKILLQRKVEALERKVKNLEGATKENVNKILDFFDKPEKQVLKIPEIPETPGFLSNVEIIYTKLCLISDNMYKECKNNPKLLNWSIENTKYLQNTMKKGEIEIPESAETYTTDFMIKQAINKDSTGLVSLWLLNTVNNLNNDQKKTLLNDINYKDKNGKLSAFIDKHPFLKEQPDNPSDEYTGR